MATGVFGEYILKDEKPKIKSGNIIVEFSSPNTNKPQHLGHVRNNLIGSSMSRIYSHIGYNVMKINLVNDRGIHICKSMLAYKKWGNGVTPESENMKGDHLVGKFYVLFDNEFKKEYDAWIKTSCDEEFEKWKNSSSGKKNIRQIEEQLQHPVSYIH